MEGSEADLAALEMDHTKKDGEEEEEKDGEDLGGWLIFCEYQPIT